MNRESVTATSARAAVWWAVLSAQILAAGLAPAAWGAEVGPAKVSGGGVSLSVDRISGRLLSLQVTGREFAAAAQPMFFLKLTDPNSLTSVSLSSDDAFAMTLAEGESGKELIVTYKCPQAVSVKVSFAARAHTRGLIAAIEVDNGSGKILEEVRFPRLLLRGKLGESARTVKLFMPGGDGYVSTREGLLRNPWNLRTYPGNASMQFMAYYDDRGGLSLQARDTGGHPKDFVGIFSRPRDRIQFGLTHRRPFVPGQGFRSSPVALLACGGDWMSAAAAYRKWARQQWWARPKTGQAAPPKWLRQGLLTLGGSFRPLGSGPHVVPIEKWPQVVRSWRQATGAAGIMLDVRGWERHGSYSSPFYFPMYPSDRAVKAMFDSIRPEPARGMAMVAGLKWMIRREAKPGRSYHVIGFDLTKQFDQQARGICVVGRDGKALIRKPVADWDGTCAFMCPAHSFTREHFLKTARKLAGAGFALFEFDQMNGGSCPACYSGDHGHPPGPGAWTIKAVARIVAETRKAGRAVDPQFATSLEDPQELLLPELDSYVSRAGHITKWPAAGRGSHVVPAFAFVYHPLARALCIDVQHSCRPDPYMILQTGRYFLAGAAPSTNMAWWQLLGTRGKDNLLPRPGKLDPSQLKLLAAVTAMHSGPALPYLSFGEMLRAEPVPLPDQVWQFKRWDGKQMVSVEVPHPPVSGSAWEIPNGRRAFVFVNFTAKDARFPYGFAAGGQRPAGRTRLRVYVNGKHEADTTAGKLKQVVVPALSTYMAELLPPSDER